ncbi:Protein kinase domain-containing protein [Apiospora marii]|uniref:Protein kinase domain-containing protein n=1 Tax=Apiospora marii TaxID=335849 RepID=UPI0031312D85
MALPLHNAQYPEHARRYEAASQEFRILRDLCTRTTHDHRKFVLVDNLTSRLREKPGNGYDSHLQCLLLHSALSCGTKPPVLNLEQLEKYIRIFYILIDLGYPQLITLFSEKGLNDSRLPLNLASIREIELGDNANIEGNFHSQFLEKQYFWCPMVFDSDEGQIRGDQIIPICTREKIDTQRGPNALSHSGASLWRIEVPEECVASRVQENIQEAKVERRINLDDGSDINVRVCVHFLPLLSIVVIGSNTQFQYYQFALKQFSKDDSDKFSKEKNIANCLKNVDGIVRYFTWYQEGDEETSSSRVSLNLVLELCEMDLYTAIRKRSPPVLPSEIKGVWESMLDIACGLKSFHQLEIMNTQFNACHGDIKPENILFVNDRFKLSDSGEARIDVSTASDRPFTRPGGTKTYGTSISSFVSGSKHILSAVADSTLQLLPRRTVQGVRGHAEEDIWSLGCVFSVVATWVVLGADGVTQYGKVRQKAQKRRTGIANDNFHDDQQVLPEVKAWHRYLRVAARRTDTITSKVLDLVDNYMLVGADIRRTAAFIVKGFAEHLSPETGSDTGFPEEIRTILLEIEQEEVNRERQGSFSEDLLTGYDIAANGGAVGYADSDSASARELLLRHTMPTVQRLPQRNLRSLETDCGSARSEGVGPDEELSITPMPTLQLDYSFSSECDAPVSIFTMEQEIDNLQGGLWSRLTRRTKSIRERKQAANNDELKNFFDNRDIIFLVDNAPSMAQHWKQVMYWATVLLKRVMDYDDDGVEMYFSQGDRKNQVKQKRRQKIAEFEKAMRSATPDPNSNPLGYSLPFALQYIFMESSQKSDTKHQTIFVFTDGIWEGGNEAGVESVIKSHMKKMGWFNSEVVEQVQEQKPLSIEFIRFGHDPNGIERLRRLDDDLVQEGYPDLIDTEPAAGDANKMLLGSLDKNIDESLNIMNRPSPSITTPTSPISPRPGSFGPYGAGP